jgi:hypothetical protein
MPMPRVLLPAGFCSANLILYWGGFDTTWKLAVAMLVGLVLFTIGAKRAGTDLGRTMRHAVWIAPWLAGHVVLGFIGRYGPGAKSILPDWVDLAVAISFSLGIFYFAVGRTLPKEDTAAAVARDAHQIDFVASDAA